jgi:hypothetical protein
VGFVVDKVALGQVFSEYFCFLCKFSFHRLLHIHHHIIIIIIVIVVIIIRGWYNRRNSGRCTKWTQSRPTPRNTRMKDERMNEDKGKQEEEGISREPETQYSV